MEAVAVRCCDGCEVPLEDGRQWVGIHGERRCAACAESDLRSADRYRFQLFCRGDEGFAPAAVEAALDYLGDLLPWERELKGK